MTIFIKDTYCPKLKKEIGHCYIKGKLCEHYKNYKCSYKEDGKIPERKKV